MASSLKLVCFFFLLTTLLFSLQTYARDSHFFSKVSRNRDTTITPNTNNNYFNTKENAFEPLNKQEEQQEQPTFIPQTTETGYGLYGHETGLEPPSTTTSKTSLYNMDENNNNNYDENFNNFYKNNNENDHEKNYVPELKGLSSTSYTNEPNKFINNNNYNNNNDNNNNNNDNNNKYNNNDEGKFYGVGYNNGMGENQGMSDTRFMENGKYFYDLNNEKNKYDSNNNYMSYSNKYDNNYKTNEYYGNKENIFDEFYNNNNNNNNNYNNNNKFYNGNGMKGYQNQETEEEFDFDQP